MKTRDEMVYEFMVAIASAGIDMEYETPEEWAESVHFFAGLLANEVLGI